MDSLYREFLASDIKVITAMLAIVGTFIAAVLSSAGYLYRVRCEQKKSLRKVLYLLLEIRHAVIASLFDPELATEEYIVDITKRLEIRGVVAKKDEFPEVYRELIRNHFNNIVLSLQGKLDERLLSPFEEALLEMSASAPALAFQLRGRERLASVFEHTEEYISKLAGEMELDKSGASLKVMLEASSGVMKGEVLKEIHETLNKDVLLLAKACGWRDSRACKRIIKKGLQPKQSIDLSELDSVIDLILKETEMPLNEAVAATKH